MISIVLDKVDKQEYATFENMESMRESVNMHVKTIQESGLSASWQKKLIRLLDYLRDSSRTFFGLSWKSQRKIAEFFGLKKPDTVGIWLKKLVELGIVKVLPTKRSCNMQQSTNFVQILPVKIEKQGQATAENTPSETENGVQKSKTIFKTKAYSNTYQAAPTFYQRFKKFIFSTIGENQSVISKLYGIYMAHTKRLNDYEVYSSAELEHAGYEALRASVMATKTKRIKNIAGYYNGTLDKMLDRLFIAAINEE